MNTTLILTLKKKTARTIVYENVDFPGLYIPKGLFPDEKNPPAKLFVSFSSQNPQEMEADRG